MKYLTFNLHKNIPIQGGFETREEAENFIKRNLEIHMPLEWIPEVVSYEAYGLFVK